MKPITLCSILSLSWLAAAGGDQWCTTGVAGTYSSCEVDAGMHTYCCRDAQGGPFLYARTCDGTVDGPKGSPPCPKDGTRQCCRYTIG
ncbi:uncharacterized protein RCO7_08943 [Rhynchosporium graminicola]|uniref:Uncharacterized protein n=1 Tax=Rhynchosporium graminicola TaxID=2792576 RepID=A0A1E1KJU5_9HELO|nr:uncharacterized protein RCO7_08943 [Rhynchosporium commune]